MPHAALCVSRQQELAALEEELDVSMPHAALCVSRRRAATSPISRSGGFNAARSIVCVETRLLSFRHPRHKLFQCRTQHCVCRDGIAAAARPRDAEFQCRTQHCVCRDTVSRSPCPARAEKAFWKDALFCAVFGVCG